jgi:hypothetical protein
LLRYVLFLFRWIVRIVRHVLNPLELGAFRCYRILKSMDAAICSRIKKYPAKPVLTRLSVKTFSARQQILADLDSIAAGE